MKFRNVFLFLGLILTAACGRNSDPALPNSYKGFEKPINFPPVVYSNPKNGVSEAGFELGKTIFYDPSLSRNGKVSCGSCHAQVHGFADHNTPVSFGVDGKMGKRNSPPLFNLAWHPSFMWDGGVNNLEIMPVAPFTDSLEMDETMANVVLKLQHNSKYPSLFQAAFGDTSITDQRLLFALAQFMKMLVSADAKYDQVQNKKATFSTSEQNGFNIFQTNCIACHQPPLFTDFSFANNGNGTFSSDLGRERITLDPTDKGKFKVPSLRNVSLTYPYMHNGNIRTLDQVLDHYTNLDTTMHQNLDTRLRKPIVLNDDEKADLKAFLQTLTDYTFISNHQFSEPIQ